MLILASQSPRRKELLKEITPNFKIVPPNIDESAFNVSPDKLPGLLSKEKAYCIFSLYPNDEVLSSDTVVILDNVLFGKPKTEKEAYNMLKQLSGKKHVVITGYTYINKDIEITRTVKTYVYFNTLDDETILKYIKSGSPMDKAGAYGIQDTEFNLVSKIEGSLNNVIGLPIEDIKKHIIFK